MLFVLSFFFNNIIYITFVSIIIMAALIIFTSFNNNKNNNKIQKKQIGKIVTIEPLSNNVSSVIPVEKLIKDHMILEDISNSYNLCDQYINKPNDLEQHCKKLKSRECNAVNCCVLRNGTECVSGNDNGPIYHGTIDKPIHTEYYHHKNTCYPGKNECPE